MTVNEKNYFIKEKYQNNKKINEIDDFVEEYSTTEQPYVYSLARHLGQKVEAKYIIDIGCSHHEQLYKLHPEFQIIGIGCGRNLDYCKEKYLFGKWLEVDFTEPIELTLPKEILRNSIILCSDIIEHLANPTYLLNFLKKFLDYSPMGILTAIDRDLTKKNKDDGPPSNINHVREWNLEEFETLISKKFDVYDAGLTINNQFENEKNIIVNILYNNHKIKYQKNIAPSDFSVTAIISVFNEEDIVVQAIKKILDQGVKVYIIDNGSTDKTLQLVKGIKHEGIIGIERFAKESRKYFELGTILRKKLEISKKLGSGWYINTDTDEIRTTPWPGVNLRDGIYLVEKAGFNAIDFSLIQFRPTDNKFLPGTDYENYFKYFEVTQDLSHFFEIKVWKNFGQDVDIEYWAGHNTEFEGRKIFPLKFLIKHYPIRSQQHGERKMYIERQMAPSEIKKGWGAHYVQTKKGKNFIFPTSKLLKFEETSFNKIYFLERLTGIGIISEEIIENSRLKDIQIEWTKMHKKILALGSATGYVADILKQFCSMTILNNFENNLEEEFKKIENKKFDAIVMGDLFGKVNNPEKLLRKLQSVLKNEGCIIFYVPNLSHATNRLKYFNSSQNEKNGNGSNNVNCYNIDSIRSLIENANYHLINSERVNAGIFALKRKNIDPKKISQKTRNEILNESESSTLYYLLKIKKLEFSNTKYDHKEFVEKCYQEFLMRKSDQEGFEHYVALLENKEIDERKLVEIFKNSSEHKKIQDNNIFWI